MTMLTTEQLAAEFGYGSANLDALRNSGLGFVVVGHNARNNPPSVSEGRVD